MLELKVKTGQDGVTALETKVNKVEQKNERMITQLDKRVGKLETGVKLADFADGDDESAKDTRRGSIAYGTTAANAVEKVLAVEASVGNLSDMLSNLSAQLDRRGEEQENLKKLLFVPNTSTNVNTPEKGSLDNFRLQMDAANLPSNIPITAAISEVVNYQLRHGAEIARLVAEVARNTEMNGTMGQEVHRLFGKLDEVREEARVALQEKGNAGYKHTDADCLFRQTGQEAKDKFESFLTVPMLRGTLEHARTT